MGTRNPTQVRTHAQKFFLRLGREAQRSREKLDAEMGKRAGGELASPNKRARVDSDGIGMDGSDHEESSTRDPTNDYVPPGWNDADYATLCDLLNGPYSDEMDVPKKCAEISKVHLPQYTGEELEHIYYKVYKDDMRQRIGASGESSPAVSTPPSVRRRAIVPAVRAEDADAFAAPARRDREERQLRVNVSPTNLSSVAAGALLALSPTNAVPMPFSPRGLRPLTPLASPGGPLLTPTFQNLLENAPRLAHQMELATQALGATTTHPTQTTPTLTSPAMSAVSPMPVQLPPTPQTASARDMHAHVFTFDVGSGQTQLFSSEAKQLGKISRLPSTPM